MQRHWLVTLQNISSSGRSWEADVPKALLQDEACGSVNVLPSLTGDVHWRLELTRAGKLFHLNGDWKAGLMRDCSRCNAAFAWPTAGKTERFFQFGSPLKEKGDEQDGDEKDVQSYDFIAKPGEINLLDVLREDIWLAWKADVICSDSCKGLCQGCGVNLNAESCQCEQDDSNNPFAALRGLKLDG